MFFIHFFNQQIDIIFVAHAYTFRAYDLCKFWQTFIVKIVIKKKFTSVLKVKNFEKKKNGREMKKKKKIHGFWMCKIGHRKYIYKYSFEHP